MASGGTSHSGRFVGVNLSFWDTLTPMRIGIDLGGTKVEAIALASDGAEMLRTRVAAPQGDYQATINCINDLVAHVEQETGQTGTVGLAMPGAVSPATGLIKNANSTWLNGMPLNKDLTKALGREVRLANDANCFSLSEAVDGAAKDASIVFGVIIGTGCGGGIVIDRRPLVGMHSIGGEWGHNPLPHPSAHEHAHAPACYCGQQGCMETWVSGPGMAADHLAIAGQTLTAQEIAEQAAAGNSQAHDTLIRFADRMARGLAGVINVLDPDAIVLGGGLSNIDVIYELIPPRLSAYVFSDRVDVPILRNVHGDASGVRGAAWLWPLETNISGIAT